MPWLQLKLHTHPEQAQALAEQLEEAGAMAITLRDGADQPLYEPAPGSNPLWDHTEVIGLFPAETDMAELKQRLEKQAGRHFSSWQLQPLEEKDWSRAWMDGFRPMQFGKRLWICPSWHKPPQPDAINILLDPGLAFGTGTHPTTALCLEWLDSHPIEGNRVIDYGCGSGVLAIAAARLGAASVLAVDTDPQALQATRDNAVKNGVAHSIDVSLPEGIASAPAHLLIANILANPLVELAPRLAGLVAGGGFIVLSGILHEQAEEVTAAYRPWFTMSTPTGREGWVRLEGIRKPAARKR